MLVYLRSLALQDGTALVTDDTPAFGVLATPEHKVLYMLIAETMVYMNIS